MIFPSKEFDLKQGPKLVIRSFFETFFIETSWDFEEKSQMYNYNSKRNNIYSHSYGLQVFLIALKPCFLVLLLCERRLSVVKCQSYPGALSSCVCRDWLISRSPGLRAGCQGCSGTDCNLFYVFQHPYFYKEHTHPRGLAWSTVRQFTAPGLCGSPLILHKRKIQFSWSWACEPRTIRLTGQWLSPPHFTVACVLLRPRTAVS